MSQNRSDRQPDDMVDWYEATCSCCKGSGKITIMKDQRPCRKCDGTGREWVAIPKATADEVP